MTDKQLEPIEKLIERSSLGSDDARRSRARVSLSTGQAIARTASKSSRTGRDTKSNPESSPRRQG